MITLPEKLIHTLHHFVKLSQPELDMLATVMQPVQIAKGDYFLRQGKVCNQLGFLVSGVMRVYHLANDKEYTSYFNFGNRNPFVSSYSSFLSRTPSQENIHALEDCELVQITYDDLQKLYDQSLEFQKLGRLIAEYNYTLAVERIYSLQHCTAQQRYVQLLQLYPNLVNAVPHHYIASYLGITPESLSRIRKELAS
ncbi:MAG TPA: Crp/Fnr family transcriptional regulator [Chitinophagales bacterium]|nr:Crp/Fnr family transcriptional regulator [Chitinophagales bacterium]